MVARSPSPARSRSNSPVRRASPRKAPTEAAKERSRSKARSASKTTKRKSKAEDAVIPPAEHGLMEAPVVAVPKRESSRMASPSKAAVTTAGDAKHKGKSAAAPADDNWMDAFHTLIWGAALGVPPALGMASQKGLSHVHQVANFFLTIYGLHAIKARAVIVLCLFFYTTLTFIGLSLATVIATVVVQGQRLEVTHPRIQRAQQRGWAHRINAAQSNCIESLTLWTAVVGMAYLSGISEDLIMKVTLMFVQCRVLYVVCYTMGWGFCRSVSYMMGLGFLIGLLTNTLVTVVMGQVA